MLSDRSHHVFVSGPLQGGCPVVILQQGPDELVHPDPAAGLVQAVAGGNFGSPEQEPLHLEPR